MPSVPSEKPTVDETAIQTSFLVRIAQMQRTLAALQKDVKAWTPAPEVNPNDPISFRNKNPGNLRPTAKGKTRWRGEVETDNGYAKFKSVVWGTRAMMYLLKISYRRRYGLKTISDIIDRYAPLGDNAVDSHAGYKTFLEKHMKGFDDPCDFDDDETLFHFARGIARFESGRKRTPLSGEQGMVVMREARALLPN